MGKAKRATWWKVFAHQRAAVDAVQDADVGRGLKAAFAYFDGEGVGELPPGAFVVFSMFRQHIDEAVADYAASVAAGKRGADGRWGHRDSIGGLNVPMGESGEAEAEVIYCPDSAHASSDRKRKQRVYEKDSLPYKAAICLAQRIAENVPRLKPTTEKQLQIWADAFRLLHERDGYEWEIVNDVLVFATSDQFWARNILSGATFRKHFSQLLAQMGGEL